MAIKTRSGAQRYNDRMNKIWETARKIERERLARGERPNENLTEIKKLSVDNPLSLSQQSTTRT